MTTSKIQYYLEHMKEHLRIIPVKTMGLYVPGIGGAVIPCAGESLHYYAPTEVIVQEVQSPTLTSQLEAIIEARAPQAKTTKNNFIPGMHTMIWDGKIVLPLFKSNYRHWKGTLPQVDEFDAQLTKEELMPPFNTAAIPISKDGYFITPQRTSQRASHAGTLCLLNGMKYERDEGKDTYSFKELIEEGTGHELAEQNRHCVARQLNLPLYHVGRAKMMGIVSSEPAVSDYGYHVAYFTLVDLSANEIVEAANEIYGNIGPHDKGRYVRIEKQHVHPFEPDYLAKFCEETIETMAMTMQPILWLAGANEFGEKWLEKVKFVRRK